MSDTTFESAAMVCSIGRVVGTLRLRRGLSVVTVARRYRDRRGVTLSVMVMMIVVIFGAAADRGPAAQAKIDEELGKRQAAPF